MTVVSTLDVKRDIEDQILFLVDFLRVRLESAFWLIRGVQGV